MRSIKLSAFVVLAFFSFAVAALAQNNVTITSSSGAPGSDVTVEINITSDVNVSALEVTLTFDPAVLQLKPMSESGIVQGSAADSMPVAMLSEDDITAANSSGSIKISMIDMAGIHTVAAGTGMNMLDIGFTISETATEGSVALALSNTDMVDTQSGSITHSVVNGAITVTSGATGEENSIWVADANGAVGGSATINVRLTSDIDVYAVSFDLLFDQTALQIKPLSGNSVTVGSDANGLDIPALDDELIASANSSGRLPIYMFHLNIDPTVPMNKISAGSERAVLTVKFDVGADAASGDFTIGLANADLVNIADDDTTTVAIDAVSRDGTLTIGEFAPGDASGDGKVDIFDVLSVLKALSGASTVGPSDVNGDGKTNIFDVLEVLKLLKK